MEAKSQSLNCRQTSSEACQEMFQCPSCSLQLEAAEVASHCDIEIERLRRMQADAAASKATVVESTIERRQPYSIFQRIQRNRQTRLKQRTRKRATPPAPTEHTCPICNQSFPQNEIQRHASKCLRRSNRISNGANEHSSNDEEDTDDGCGEEYEEYEWAGQKRIRASSLLQGGYASIGIGQSVSNVNGQDDDDEDLNVDEDDTQIYGPAQYDEADVIPTRESGNDSGTSHNDTQEEDVTSYMRSLITGGLKQNVLLQQSQDTSTTDVTEASSNDTIVLNCQPSSSTTVSTITQPTTTSSQQIIDSLKTKLRQYETHVPSKYKCLICLDDYRNPAISVACWHVHCEECWLRSLGIRKLCPQCNLITSPKDLRRIYL